MSGRSGKGTAVTALAAALVLAACGSGDGDSGGSGSGDSSGSYHWGINAELSGPLSIYGSSIAAGVQAYINGVNASGGINGHKIELSKLDTAGDQSRAAANTTQLITANKVDAIFGHALSSNCAAGQPIAERYKVPQACLSVAKSSPYVFNLGPNSGSASAAMLEMAKKLVNKPAVNAAVLMPTTLTAQQLKKGIEEAAGGAGITISSVQDFEVTAADLSAQIATIVAAKPDAILISATGPGFLTVLRGVRAAGIQAPLIWVDGTANLASVAKSNDPGVYAFLVHELVDPATASGAAKEFTDAVKPLINGELTKVSLNGGDYAVGYATARAFGAALKKCGFPCSGEQLQKQLEQTKIELDGLVPTFAYEGDDHYPYQNWLVYRVQGTQTQLVATLPAAPAK